MKHKHILAFLCCTGSLFTASGQLKNTISGKVLQDRTGAAIPNASVFITNSSKGTMSDSSGAFELPDVPAGTYDLVVSSIGYTTRVYTYKAEQLPLKLEVRLRPKVEVLQDVVVEPDEKNGWEKWKFFFTQNFLGGNEAGRSCEIKNYKTLRFRYSKSRNTLHVLADDPLIIENKVLGYQVKYQLEDFRFNFQTHVLLFYGYSLFTELNKNGPTPRQLKNREKAYNGSVAHFMRSLYRDSLQAEGFEVRRLVKRPNLEKQRVEAMYTAAVKKQRAAHPGYIEAPDMNTIGDKDSGSYYTGVLRQQSIIEEYGPGPLTADSLLLNRDSVSRKLFFNNYLSVIYTKAKEDQDYLDYNHENRRPGLPRSSALLPGGLSITIEPNGNYYEPQDFLTIGYWAWNEKVGILLPVDYRK